MWQVEWNALSIRIQGIIDASTFLFQTAQAGESDWAYSTDILGENCDQTVRAVLALQRYGSALPVKAFDALTRFEKWWTDTAVDAVVDKGFPKVQALVVLLASIRSELDHLMSDHQAIIRDHVTRAFIHLQRSLTVDAELRAKWLSAFDKGETSCEQLGALHLLLHGVWAFKVSSTGERTDLILGTRLVVADELLQATHGLVLTEWKLVRHDDSPETKRNAAKSQAARYSEGCLGGFELESDRFLVLVSKREFDIPADEKDGTHLYKVIPLVLDREVPSVAASNGSTSC